MRISQAFYLIIDLEATCSDTGEVPPREMETIEIGAVIQCAKTFEVQSELQQFIKPVRHPNLTEFCTQLTSIRQADVDAALPFFAAMQRLQQWLVDFPDYLFCSWGDYDKRQIEQDCQFHGVGYPFTSTHMNLKKAFSESLGLKKKFGMAEALKHLGLKLQGTHHRGIDDARNMAQIVRGICIGV
jgi:inhibitor of KinA sporulation pathway (predicted exonuclease)